MKPLTTTIALCIGLASASGANATLLAALGGAVVNDTNLNITWIANANLAASNTFGVSGINADGTMSWDTALSWIGAMNISNYLGFNDWRLPTLADTGTSGCNFAFSGTDCGFNVNTANSEIAHLFYNEFGNKAIFDTFGNIQPGFGLVDDLLNLSDESLFINLQTVRWYFFGTEYAPDIINSDWVFSMYDGAQQNIGKGLNFAMAVRSGQVATASVPLNVPEPATLALFGMGLVGLGWARRKTSIVNGKDF